VISSILNETSEIKVEIKCQESKEKSGSKQPQRVIIDTDPGVDDCMALFFALKSPEIRVEALTIVMGNNDDVDLLARNACLVLEMANRSDVKVVKGATKPMSREFSGFGGIRVHGPNAIGGVKTEKEPSLDPIYSKDGTAAEFLVKYCTENPGEITLITIGPLTNIGHAIQIGGEKFIKSVRRVVIMGGSFDGKGNKTPAAEANIHNDPEAAQLVFASFPDIALAGLNVTRQVSLSSDLRQRLRKLNKVGKFLFDISQHYVDILSQWGAEIVIHDLMAVMEVVRPDFFDSTWAYVDVETQGKITAGATVADWRGQWGKTPQTKILTKVLNEKEVVDFFVSRIAEYR